MSKTKKILIILGVVLTITFVAILVYYLFFKESLVTEMTAPSGVEGEEIGLADQSRQRLIAITEESVLGAQIDSEEGKVVYLALDGSINRINSDGTEKTKIGIMSAEGAGEVSVSSGGKTVLAKITSQTGAVKYVVYNSEKNSLRSLPERTIAASLDPTGEKAAIAVSESFSSAKISIINLEDGKETVLTSTKIPDLLLDWHENENIVIKTRPSGLAFGILYNLNVKTKKITRILGNINGLTALFSPSSKKILISETYENGKSWSVSALNTEKNSRQGIGVFTMPEKCAWFSDDRTIICAAINGKNADNYLMPDDYYKGKVKFSSEDILRINLDMGETQKLINDVITAGNLFLSQDESYLFFINKIDGRLYRLTL